MAKLIVTQIFFCFLLQFLKFRFYIYSYDPFWVNFFYIRCETCVKDYLFVFVHILLFLLYMYLFALYEDVQLFQHHLFLHCVAVAPLSKISWLCLYGSVSGLYFVPSVCLSIGQYDTASCGFMTSWIQVIEFIQLCSSYSKSFHFSKSFIFPYES